MPIKGDLLIRGGSIVDPARSCYGTGDVLISGNKISDVPAGQVVEADKTIEAAGCLVLPGLIDYHAHLYYGGSEIGVPPDSALLPQGVTTAVDQGSTGAANFEHFARTVMSTSEIRIFASLNVSPAGLPTTRYPEMLDSRYFDFPHVRSLFEKYGGQLVSLKVRQSKEVVGELGMEPLKQAVRMASSLGCRVVVHTTNPPGTVEDMISLLRPGDVYAHVYQGKGNHILDDKGKVFPGVRRAGENGVIFDTADGKPHYAFSVARAAIADGFEPDIISSDVTFGTLFDLSVFGLPLIMSKYLNLGISLHNVVKACTVVPAYLLGMDGKIGTLAPGAYADVAIFKLADAQTKLQDVFGGTLTCSRMLVPQMTILGGRIAYRNAIF